MELHLNSIYEANCKTKMATVFIYETNSSAASGNLRIRMSTSWNIYMYIYLKVLYVDILSQEHLKSSNNKNHR